MIIHSNQTKMNILPDVLTNAILLRLNVPIELRTIITENYFPFLPNERGPLLLPNDIYILRTFENIYVMTRNWIDDIDVEKGYKYYLHIHNRIREYRIVVKCKRPGYHPDILSYNNKEVYESLLPRHPDISFQISPEPQVSIIIESKEVSSENEEDVCKTILKWYRKIVYLAIFSPEDIGCCYEF